jgi:hypothetical protein
MAIATGQPTKAIWEINDEIIRAGAFRGLDLSGTWGTHMTVSRFLEDKPATEVDSLVGVLDHAPDLGLARPTGIEVGYFHTDPEQGFVMTSHEQFDL